MTLMIFSKKERVQSFIKTQFKFEDYFIETALLHVMQIIFFRQLI